MKINRFIKWLGIISAVIILSLGIFVFTAEEVKNPPSFDRVKEATKKSEALILDRYGQVVHEMRVDTKGRRLEWMALKELSPAFIKVVLYAEDRRFYLHHGVDWPGLFFSFIKNPLSSKMRGASTISMQLAALLDKRLKPKKGRKTLNQKWIQIRAAYGLEKTWSKGQILEAYLNLISYRTELQGIAAASKGIFAKEPSGLNEPESLVLATLISSPNAPNDHVARRACTLGRSMDAQTSAQPIKQLVDEKLRSPYQIKPLVALAPQAALILLKGGRTKVLSTLDGKLQRFAQETLGHYIESLKEAHVSDGSVLVVENKTGEILAYVGNSGPASSAVFLDGITARRQAGSTLKPFLYELAVEKGLLTAASLLEDSPLQIPTPTGLYVPQNYDNSFRGPVSVRTALSSSINIPAVRTLLLVGLDPFVNRLKQLGFEGLKEEEEYYGYSLALGSADITLYQLVNAYRTLATGGLWSELKLDLGQKMGKPRRVLDQKAAFIISHILSDREARSITFGLENPLSTRFWTAAKTGTSKDMRDNWCLGYSEKYTVGVWVGNFSGEPMRNVSGVSGAAPVWLEIMTYLHGSRSSNLSKPPPGVIMAEVAFHNDLEFPRKEYFIQGSEPESLIRTNILYQKPRITYPVHDTLISLDPEIPEDLQRVPLQFQPPAQQYEWVLNNRKTGVTDPFFLWKPDRGIHVVSIVDKENRVVDSVAFVVR